MTSTIPRLDHYEQISITDLLHVPHCMIDFIDTDDRNDAVIPLHDIIFNLPAFVRCMRVCIYVPAIAKVRQKGDSR